jgi:hypothetical protein
MASASETRANLPPSILVGGGGSFLAGEVTPSTLSEVVVFVAEVVVGSATRVSLLGLVDVPGIVVVEGFC